MDVKDLFEKTWKYKCSTCQRSVLFFNKQCHTCSKSEKVLNLLSDLAAFNQLNEKIVIIISNTFNIDAKQLCKDNGIVYFIK